MHKKRRTGSFFYEKSNSKKRGKRRSLLPPLLLVLFCITLIYGAFFFFSNPGENDQVAPPESAEEKVGESNAQDEGSAAEEEAEALQPATEEADEAAKSPAIPQPDQRALKVVSDGNYPLALVTKETTLKSSYTPPDLQRIPEYMYPARELWLREEALRQLALLWQAALDDGVALKIISAYRSYDYQKTLFQNYANSYGEEAANRFSARAGQSEHQLGTTVDFGGTNVDLKAAYAETNQGRWLAENAYKFGYAMSYPEGGEEITGYIFEPWHYRYIGVLEAAEWHLSGLTLKEFLEQKPQYFD